LTGSSSTSTRAEQAQAIRGAIADAREAVGRVAASQARVAVILGAAATVAAHGGQ
jgi:hypothetical protein